MEQPVKVGYVETKSVMTKSNAPLGGYSVNPYVGCPHACRYCYASFMKRFTGHTEDWGTFMDVKEWPEITNPKKYAGQKVIIGTVSTEVWKFLCQCNGDDIPLDNRKILCFHTFNREFTNAIP